MVLTLDAELEAALVKTAVRKGVKPEELALNALRERFVSSPPPIEPRDEWERRLLGIATDCGVALTHEDVSSEGLYE